jgi:hypothetical protein
MVPLTLTPIDPPKRVFALCSWNPVLYWHRSLSSKRKKVSTRQSHNEWRLRLCLWISKPKRELLRLLEWLILTTKAEIELLVYNVGKESISGLQELLLRVSWHYFVKQSNPGRTSSDQDPWGVKTWVTLLGKKTRPVEVIVEPEGYGRRQ